MQFSKFRIRGLSVTVSSTFFTTRRNPLSLAKFWKRKMQITLLFEFHSLISGPNFPYKSSGKPTLSPSKESLISQIHVQRPIVSAWKRTKRSGSSRSTKILLESAYLVASKLKIFPEPLELLIREFYGGNGGGGLFFKGYGGEGSGGRRRRGKRNWAFLGTILILGMALSLALWKEYDVDKVFGVLGLSLFGVSVNVWKRGALDWVLGFCCCAALGGFLMKEDLQRSVKFLGTMKVSRRRKGRWF